MVKLSDNNTLKLKLEVNLLLLLTKMKTSYTWELSDTNHFLPKTTLILLVKKRRLPFTAHLRNFETVN